MLFLGVIMHQKMFGGSATTDHPGQLTGKSVDVSNDAFTTRGGMVTQPVDNRTCNQKVVRSTPGRGAAML